MNFDPENFTETQQKLFETLKFIGKLLLAGTIFQLILYIYPSTEFLQAGLAQIISAMLHSTGFQPITEGISITISSTEYIISQDCLGWKSIAAFVALIYASTERTLEHFTFIIQGATAIFLANIIRVYTTVILAEKGIISFSIIHDVLWRWSLTLLVLIMWIYWFKKLKGRSPIYQQRIQEQVRKLKEK
jgi:exosortase/archaeosortase family protein